jgi:hypothetical protein
MACTRPLSLNSEPTTINAELAEPGEKTLSLFCELCGFCVECRAHVAAPVSRTRCYRPSARTSAANTRF